MSSWVGDWGFEPEVSRLLEHAILPESRPLKKASNAGTAMVEEVMNAVIFESPEFDFNNYFESANCTDQSGTCQGSHLNGLPYLALESHGIKSSSQFQGAIDTPISVNWLIDDRRSETITTSSGDQSQGIEGDMDMQFADWPSCLDLELFESEPSACLPSNISSAYYPQAPAVLQDNAGL
ncbi:unnamed protein product [Clonostachys chloroleuca]|uniref:Uncharacterized protein n=1 Tax=Clonostachys chloroleuca TaxID=1926264 RepID=A0AA35VM52_9HYPO|nr:unnamed protein product [Clonostachys chloroleuca]